MSVRKANTIVYISWHIDPLGCNYLHIGSSESVLILKVFEFEIMKHDILNENKLPRLHPRCDRHIAFVILERIFWVVDDV